MRTQRFPLGEELQPNVFVCASWKQNAMNEPINAVLVDFIALFCLLCVSLKIITINAVFEHAV